MSCFKILLVSLYNSEAYGLRILHSILTKEGYEVKMLFLKTEKGTFITKREIELFFNFLKKYKPDVVGFSLVSPNFMLYKNIYSEVRKMGKFKIVVGGWQASLNPEETIKYCDYLCVGEGEEAIKKLIWFLSRGIIPPPIPNIWVNKEDIIIKNEAKPLEQNLSKYPTCLINNNYSYIIEKDTLSNQEPYFLNSRYGIMISRGCPYHCTYCSNSYMQECVYPNEWSKIRYRSVSHIMKELKQVKKLLPNVDRINFYDEIFLPKKEWAIEFLKRYKQEIGLPFYCMFYPGTCNEELIKLMKEAGLAGVWLGIQSGSEKIRKYIYKRYYSNKDILKQANLFNKYNISVKYDFIFDNPFENIFDRWATLRLMKKLPKPKLFNFFSLKYFPNTEITKMALEKKLITQKELDDNLDIICPEYEISEKRKLKILRRINE